MMASSGAVAVFTISLITYAIAEYPCNTTVFLNQKALFRCVTHGIPLYMYWKVNDTAFTSLPSDIRVDMDTDQVTVGENEEFILTIPGRAEYNGTRVQCVAGDEGGEDESENATLSIQGLLSSVGGLGTISNTSSINISWTAPFSLDVTDVDPDIWYSILIYNVTDEDNTTTIPCTKCINITETYYNFTPDHFSPCQMYNFTIIPYNGAGQGKSSLNVSAISHEKPSTLFSMTDVRAVNGGSECNVTFQALGDVGSGCKYTLRIAGGVDGAIPISTAELEFGGYFSYPLPADRRYTTNFEIETADGIKDNVNITYTTFDVQNVTVEENGGSIAVTGKFLTDTFAMGCFIVVQFNESTADEHIALLQNELKQTVHKTINVLSSTYKLYAYDIEDNGLPNETPAIVQEHEKNISTHYSTFNSNSTILTTTNISVNGLQVIIDCEFAKECVLASCVLIYCEYGDASLTVIDYNRATTVFPVSVSVDQPENFTFALFGRNCKGEIEERPAIQLKFDAMTTSPNASSQMNTAALVGGTVVVVVVIAIASTGLIIVFIVVVRKQRNVEGTREQEMGETTPHDGTGGEEVETDSVTATKMATEGEKEYPVQGSQDLEMGEITSDNGTEDEEVEKDSATTRRIATEGEKKFAAHGSQKRIRIVVDPVQTPYTTIPHATSSTDIPLRRRPSHKTYAHSGNKE